MTNNGRDGCVGWSIGTCHDEGGHVAGVTELAFIVCGDCVNVLDALVKQKCPTE
ncbi:MAG: hypothetical protein RL691_121 [Actinomycetota bacterium]